MPGLGAELLLAEVWIDDVLKTDPAIDAIVAGRVFPDVAPDKTATPFIVYQHQASTDMRGVGSETIFVNADYVVKVVGKPGDTSTAIPVVRAIYSAMHQQFGVNVGTEGVLSCVREAPFKLVENVSGQKYLHIGHQFRIQIQDRVI